MKRLLYDLHNEVLEAAEIRINTECSLTTREGVSGNQIIAGRAFKFPHYT